MFDSDYSPFIFLIVFFVFLLIFSTNDFSSNSSSSSNSSCVSSHNESSICSIPFCHYTGYSTYCVPHFYSCDKTVCDNYVSSSE